MKTLSLTAALVAFVTLVPSVGAATFRSSLYFDELIQVTPRVISGSIYRDIDRVHPLETLREYPTLTQLQQEALRAKVTFNRQRNGIAVRAHCQSSLRASDPKSLNLCVASEPK